MLTDGKASRAFSHRLPAIRSLGIEVFTIGIGDDIDESELNLIASIPSSEHVTILDNIGNINRFIGSLSSSTCRSEFSQSRLKLNSIAEFNLCLYQNLLLA